MGVHNAITAQEIAVIRAMALAGHSAAAIARAIGRNASCIIKHAPECGARYFHWSTWTVKKVPAQVQRRAEAAAARYQMDVETLVYQIAAGALMRGSVHKSLTRYQEYESDRRTDICDSHSSRERKRAGEGGNGQSPEV
jgi:hypothetical protein